MNKSTPPTIIVGGGFVGLFTALHLSHHHYQEPIILIEPQERFVFKPLLYEYLSGEMEDEQVLPRYEELLQGSQVTFVQDRVTGIDLEQHRVELASGLHYNYRYLVLGVGGTQGYFGTEGAEQNSFPFRTQEDAINLEQHLRANLQQACQNEDVEIRKNLLTVAVVGAGPSGVEIAATLADLLPSWYVKLGGDINELRVALINHGEEILSGDINEKLQKTALEALKERTIPVELLLGVKVKAVTPNSLEYEEKKGSTKTIPTSTTIWTAGTETNSVIKNLALAQSDRDKHGLPLVTSTLQLLNYPEVFAAGDCASVQDHALPPVAQVAYQQGAGIAKNLIALSEGKAPHSVEVNLRGTLLKLGIGNGVANLFDRLQVNGKTGDLIRNGTYLELLPTPVHNFKATTEWLTDEIFHRYHQPETITPTKSRSTSGIAKWVGGSVVAIAVIAGSFVVWRNTHTPSQQQPTPTQLQRKNP